jgi:hypothetical protein
MKQSLLILFTAFALVGCSPNQGGGGSNMGDSYGSGTNNSSAMTNNVGGGGDTFNSGTNSGVGNGGIQGGSDLRTNRTTGNQ